MGALVMIEFLTVDGVMQGLGSPGEDPEGGFVHGGWGAPYAESVHQVTASSGFARTSSYLFGRRTYEKMAAFWPHQPDGNVMAAHLNATPKHVAGGDEALVLARESAGGEQHQHARPHGSEHHVIEGLDVDPAGEVPLVPAHDPDGGIRAHGGAQERQVEVALRVDLLPVGRQREHVRADLPGAHRAHHPPRAHVHDHHRAVRLARHHHVLRIGEPGHAVRPSVAMSTS